MANANDLQLRQQIITIQQELARLRVVERGLGGGAQVLAVNVITAASVTLDTTYCVVLCDATSNAITVNLPAISAQAGIIYHIKKIDASANAVTVEGNASETIDGSLNQIITTQYTNMMIVAGLTEWSIL